MVTGKKAKQLRAVGYVPAAPYGPEIVSINLQIAGRDLQRTVARAGTTNLVSVQVEPEGKKHTALVGDIRHDVTTGSNQHVDSLHVIMGEKTTTEVSIVPVGEAATQGSLVQAINTVEVECLPRDLVCTFEVDRCLLNSAGDIITIKDLDVPDSITILAHGETLVAYVEASREMEAEPIGPVFQFGELRSVFEESPDK